jgi:hypothetical protein
VRRWDASVSGRPDAAAWLLWTSQRGVQEVVHGCERAAAAGVRATRRCASLFTGWRRTARDAGRMPRHGGWRGGCALRPWSRTILTVLLTSPVAKSWRRRGARRIAALGYDGIATRLAALIRVRAAALVGRDRVDRGGRGSGALGRYRSAPGLTSGGRGRWPTWASSGSSTSSSCRAARGSAGPGWAIDAIWAGETIQPIRLPA